MSERKLGVKPPRRPDVSGFDAEPAKPADSPSGPSSPAAAEVSVPTPTKATTTTRRRPKTRQLQTAQARRRVHVTLARETAQALRAKVEESGATNTQVLIDAHTAAAPSVMAEQASPGPFAPRRTHHGREGAYFYLAADELSFLAAEANKAGFETRSAHFDALLTAYLRG